MAERQAPETPAEKDDDEEKLAEAPEKSCAGNFLETAGIIAGFCIAAAISGYVMGFAIEYTLLTE